MPKKESAPGAKYSRYAPEGRSRPYGLAIIKTSLQPRIFSWPIVMAGNYVNKHGIFLERKKTHFFYFTLQSHSKLTYPKDSRQISDAHILCLQGDAFGICIKYRYAD